MPSFHISRFHGSAPTRQPSARRSDVAETQSDRAAGIPARSILLLIFLGLLPAAGTAQQPHSPVPVIPRPLYVMSAPGTCIVSAETRIEADTLFSNAASQLAAVLGIPAQEVGSGGGATVIRLLRSGRVMAEEGYTLAITPEEIRIEAVSDAGAFYAVQSLRQMFPACVERGSRFRAWRLPCTVISDVPRFRWRGVMLDCSRHFVPVEDVKRIIDRLAALKINRMHWHLTDDQGWRLEIRAYPELTATGAWRRQDSMRYGGYYTQDEVREIIAFADARHIVIVPEIDMPGHTTAALASYPWLGCDGRSLSVPAEWGIFSSVMCAGRESTYAFVERVLTEVAALFPSPWIHVGGDECMRDQWNACDSCQASLRRNALPGSYALQSHFTSRVEHMCAELGKQVIGWNEIMAGASKKTLVQGWYDIDIAVEAARQGFQVIASPINPYYLNYHAGVNTLKLVYDFDPLKARKWPNNGDDLLGVECCLWSESQTTPAHFDIALFPRVAAFAETAWSHPTHKNWPDFAQRIAVYGGRWAMQGQRFAALDSIDWDDGLPLTVERKPATVPGVAAVSLSGAASGAPVMALVDAACTATGTPHPYIVRHDSTDMLVSYGRASASDASCTVLTGLRKPANPWSEVLDSTSADGWWHLDMNPGDESLSPHLSVSTYPHPLRISETGGRLLVELHCTRPDPVRLRLTDARGVPVFSDRITGLFVGVQKLSLPLPALPAGIYFLVVDDGRMRSLRKLCIVP